MAQKQVKRPRDLNQWAKRMIDLATGAGPGAILVAQDIDTLGAASRAWLADLPVRRFDSHLTIY